jgi:hypothetical protein
MMRKNTYILVLTAVLIAATSVVLGEVNNKAKNESSAPASQPAAPTTRPAPVKKVCPVRPSLRDKIRRKHRKRLGTLTEKQETETLGYLKENRPEHYQKILVMQKTYPHRYQRTLHWIHSRRQKLPSDIFQAVLEQKEQEARCRLLIRQIQSAGDPEEKDKLQEWLRQAVGKHFDAEQRSQLHRLREMEEQIEQIRKGMKERNEQRGEIIADRVELWLASPGDVSPRHPPRHRPSPETRKVKK